MTLYICWLLKSQCNVPLYLNWKHNNESRRLKPGETLSLTLLSLTRPCPKLVQGVRLSHCQRPSMRLCLWWPELPAPARQLFIDFHLASVFQKASFKKIILGQNVVLHFTCIKKKCDVIIFNNRINRSCKVPKMHFL